MRGFRALHISLLAPNLLLCAPHGRIRSGQLRRQLRHFQHRQGLPLLHVIAHIHINFLDVARDLRVHFDVLKWFELARNIQRVFDRSSLHPCHCHYRGASAHRMFRIIRFLKLARYSPAMRSLMEVLYNERRALFGLVHRRVVAPIDGQLQPELAGAGNFAIVAPSDGAATVSFSPSAFRSASF